MYRGTTPDITDEQMVKLLKDTRDKLNMNTVEMAKKLNIPYNTYVGWEHGRITIRHKTIMRLALITLSIIHGDENEEGSRNDGESDEPIRVQETSGLQD